MKRLADMVVLAVDCQTTGPSPQRGGHLIEVGWSRGRAGEPAELASNKLIRLPDDVELPRRVAELTGIDPEELAGGCTAAEAWQALVRDAAEIDPVAAPAVIHYARLEESFLRPLHCGDELPLDIIDTHQIARRVLPRIPRRGLRALAGYFGHSVPSRRRCSPHVEATMKVWAHLIELLERGWGITTLTDLRQWLARKPAASSSKRSYPMSRRRRLSLPDRPGIYRMLRSNGDLLYIGKAASLRARVNTYFQKQRGIPERTLEMLTQARDISYTVTATALEAALLESDEIKRWSPPYNVALRARGRRVAPIHQPDDIAVEGEDSEEALARLERMMRRTHWLCRLSESVLLFRERCAAATRMLVIRSGSIIEACDADHCEHPPEPPGAGARLRLRLERFDLATYDRMRVLSTELRRLVDEAEAIQLRLARNVWLDRDRLARTLAWV
jgi:DNA polymerase-3 subunit epsilon